MTRRATHLFAALLFVLAGLVSVLLIIKPNVAVSDADPASRYEDIYAELAERSSRAVYGDMSGDWRLRLPEDHGGHEEARVETWSVVAHLGTAEGDALGLQFSMARLGLVPPDEASSAPDLAPSSLYRGHVVFAEGGAGLLLAEERFSRGLGAAGHDRGTREVWIDDWRLAYDDGSEDFEVDLYLSERDLHVSLRLSPEKPFQPIDADAARRGFTSPRLEVTGTVGTEAVQGTAMFSHIWGDVPLPGSAVTNDVLAVHLDDGSDVSLIRTGRRNGRATVLDGFLVNPEGDIRPLSDDLYDVDFSDAAALSVIGPGLDLVADARVYRSLEDFSFGFDTGLLDVTGFLDSRPVTGLATLQRIGYGR